MANQQAETRTRGQQYQEKPAEESSTDYDSKMVMLRAERDDEVMISSVTELISQKQEIPELLRVAQRVNTYFGPKLKLTSNSGCYLLTAPGPDKQLLLWFADTDPDGFRKQWKRLAEVQVRFSDEQPSYDLCPYCGKPLKTLEHEREAAIGQCSRVD